MKELSLQFIEDQGWKPYAKSIMHWFKLEGMFLTPGGRHNLTQYTLKYDDTSKEVHIEALFGSMSEGMLFEGIIETEKEFLSVMKMLRINGKVHSTKS